MGISYGLISLLIVASVFHLVTMNLESGSDFSFSPLVKVKQGLLRGQQRMTFNGRRFWAFTGIPYAQPPIGSLRFQKPEPARPWGNVLEAIEPRPVCPQMDLSRSKVIGQEDCLYLNIYTPQIPSVNRTKKFPVMVWIHGGGFLIGDSVTNVGPKRLLEKNIVLVSINYRLGALGFLSTNDDASPGNFGLWDQRLALKWIRDNIEVFGGDPHLVTLFGESSGAASVGFHLISSASKDLFHRVILQSGSPFCHWAIQDNPLKYTSYLAHQLNCSTVSTTDLINCLRNKSMEEIIQIADSVSYKVGMFPLGFVPVVEKSTKLKFIEDHPINLFRQRKINRVPVISGFTEQEGIDTVLIEWHKMVQMKEIEIVEFVGQMITHFGGVSVNSISQVKKLYLDSGLSYDIKDRAFIQSLIDIVSDGAIKACHHLTVQQLIEIEIPTYEFRMEHEMYKNLFTFVDRQNFSGAAHGEELLLLFDSVYAPQDLEGNDKILSEHTINMWTNFAKYGDPTPQEANNQLKTRWSPVLSQSFLSLQVPVIEQPKTKPSKTISFWIEQMMQKQSYSTFRYELCSSAFPIRESDFNNSEKTTNPRTDFELFLLAKESTCEIKKDYCLRSLGHSLVD